MARRGYVLDLCRVEGGKARGRPNLAGKVKVWRAAHALHRDQVGQTCIGVDMATHHIEEIDHAAFLEAARYLQTVLRRQAAGQVLVAGVAHTDDELRANALADRRQHLEGEAQPVVH